MTNIEPHVNQLWGIARQPGAGPAPVVVRIAGAADRVRLRRLAERDSSRVPAGPLIVAEVGGELRAAASVADRRSIADPFHPTAEVAALVELRAAQLRAARERRAARLARTPSAARAGWAR